MRLATGSSRLPGVIAQGQVSVLPLTGVVGWGSISVEGYIRRRGRNCKWTCGQAGGDYFRAMKIPLLKGRYFDAHDTSDGQQVVMIDEQFAHALLAA